MTLAPSTSPRSARAPTLHSGSASRLRFLNIYAKLFLKENPYASAAVNGIRSVPCGRLPTDAGRAADFVSRDRCRRGLGDMGCPLEHRTMIRNETEYQE